ncbi:LysR family transcriptional regulator [Saccharicrinis aurantiacus]|uniref:LysR family transcriptional regulator n=1 Tax=Saccharicrinis aurantiacus TaxID=1849719 RepID=UPI00094FABEA|nr:LysR family transcriptional regulator [Saccharicrinis aurantiacus]
MDERLLRFFVAVYEEKNLSRAAEKCFVSQPNISNGIKQLEELIGKPLFNRHKRGVELKEDAHYLYPIAKRIIGELQSIPEIFREGSLKQKVVVGIADSISQHYKRSFFNILSNEINNIEWDLRPMAQECELNILVREWKFESHHFLPLWKENYVLCIPENHPLAEKDIIDLIDLKNQPFIHCPPCEAHQQSLSILNTTGDKWNTVANCATKTDVLTMLMAGLGISFLPEYLIEGAKGFVVKPYNGPKYYREIGLSYAKDSLNNPAVKQIIEHYSK